MYAVNAMLVGIALTRRGVLDQRPQEQQALVVRGPRVGAAVASSAYCFALCAAVWRAVTNVVKVFPTFATAACTVGSE